MGCKRRFQGPARDVFRAIACRPNPPRLRASSRWRDQRTEHVRSQTASKGEGCAIPGLLVMLALAVAPSPQIWGSKLPKSRNVHAGDSTSLHNPIIDFSRVLPEHPQTGI